MSDCLFCRIIAGEIPSTKLYEDNEILAFRDISPAAPHHVLVIPKDHIASAADIGPHNSDVIGKIFEVIAQIAKQEKYDMGFRVVSNSGVQAQQSVAHLHFHILAGRDMTWPPG